MQLKLGERVWARLGWVGWSTVHHKRKSRESDAVFQRNKKECFFSFFLFLEKKRKSDSFRQGGEVSEAEQQKKKRKIEGTEVGKKKKSYKFLRP